MLEVALEREVDGDLFLQDIGQGFGFRPGSFDGAIRRPIRRHHRRTVLNRFFTTLYSALRNPSRAVLQFYPSSDDQIQLITSIAQRAGFGGGIVVDYPNSKKAKKVFLCLFVGGGGGGQQHQLPKGLETEDEQVPFERRREKEKKRDRSGKRKALKDRDWILKKKTLYRQRGKEDVPRDSKYTGRKRKPTF
ncbi:methyltransferase [Chiua virens]|nr:methyltransferase [Chiua virens]